MKDRRIHKGHIFGLSAFLTIPLAIFISKALAPLFVLTAVLALLVDFLDQRKLPKLPPTFAALFALLVIWGLVSTIWSISPGDSVGLALPLAGTFLGGLVLVSLAAKLTLEERHFFETALLAGMGLGFVILAIEIFTPLALTKVLVPLFKGYPFAAYRAWLENEPPYGRPNYYKNGAMMISLLIWPATIILLRRISAWRRRTWLLTAALLAAALFVLINSGSGSAVLGLMVGGAVFYMAYAARDRAGKILSILVVVVASAMPFLPNLVPTADEIEGMSLSLPQSVYPRIFIWQNASKFIFEDPILGKGLDTSRAISKSEDRVIFSTYGKDLRSSEPIPLHPHNAILQVWLELGVVGALIMLAILLALIRRIEVIADQRAVRAICFAMFFTAFSIANVSYGIWQSWWLGTLWLTAAYMIGSLAAEAGD